MSFIDCIKNLFGGKKNEEAVQDSEPNPTNVVDIPPEEDDDIITLVSADGEELDFIEVAAIAHNGSFYSILQPVELPEDMDDDEALIFKVSKDDDDEEKFEIELDDEIIDAVFKEYNRLLDEQDNK